MYSFRSIFLLRQNIHLFLGSGKLLTHGIDGLLVGLDGAGLLQDGTSSNEHVDTGLADLLDVVDLDTSVDLEAAVNAGLIDELASLTGLLEGGGDEGLSTEAGVDAHEEDDVELVEDEVGVVEGGSGVEDEAGLAAAVLDELEGAVDVVGGLGVEGDVGGTGVDEVGDGGVDGADHEVDVDGGGNAVVAEGLADHGADGEVGDVVVVHDVEVDDVGAGFEDVVDLLTELGKVGGKDGGGDEVVLVSPNVEGGGGTGRSLGDLLCQPSLYRFMCLASNKSVSCHEITACIGDSYISQIHHSYHGTMQSTD